MFLELCRSKKTCLKLVLCLGLSGLSLAGADVYAQENPAFDGIDPLADSRTSLEELGVFFDASLTADWSVNMHGGVNTEGSTFRNLFNANLLFDLDTMLDWQDGVVSINFQNHNGPNGSIDVGDIQGYDNIDADGRTQVAELWFEQLFADGQLRIKVGKVDANSEFAYVDYGCAFINSSMGFSPTIFVMPTYPDPAMSVNVFVYPTDSFYAGAGLYDGSLQEGIPTGSRGPKTFFSEPSDLFIIAEAGVMWGGDKSLYGRLGAGGWWHTGTFDRFDSTVENGTGGFYIVFDQLLWRENPEAADDEQGIGLFLQYGYADEQVSEVTDHVGAGLEWTGALSGRDDDVLGIGATYVRLSDEPTAGFVEDNETAIELFYSAQLGTWLSVKPDLQYIFNPGGAGLEDAIVGTVRVEFVY